MANTPIAESRRSLNPGCFVVLFLFNILIAAPLLGFSGFFLGNYVLLVVWVVSIGGIIVINATKYRIVGGILLLLPILTILLMMMYQTLIGYWVK